MCYYSILKYFKIFDYIFFILFSLEYIVYDIKKDNIFFIYVIIMKKILDVLKNIYEYIFNNIKILKNILVKKFY